MMLSLLYEWLSPFGNGSNWGLMLNLNMVCQKVVSWTVMCENASSQDVYVDMRAL